MKKYEMPEIEVEVFQIGAIMESTDPTTTVKDYFEGGRE